MTTANRINPWGLDDDPRYWASRKTPSLQMDTDDDKNVRVLYGPDGSVIATTRTPFGFTVRNPR